jgi:hypothetical protein
MCGTLNTRYTIPLAVPGSSLPQSPPHLTITRTDEKRNTGYREDSIRVFFEEQIYIDFWASLEKTAAVQFGTLPKWGTANWACAGGLFVHKPGSKKAKRNWDRSISDVYCWELYPFWFPGS